MPHLVTSQQAQDHIRDFNDARYNAGIVGNGFYLLQGQGNMEATMVNSNTLRIMSGDAIANGRHWSIDDSYEEYTIENGTPGYKRIDLAVAHIETMPKATIEIRILKGEEATGTPEKPSYIEGDLNDGDTVIEVPICSVLIDGINPGEPVSEMMILMSYDEFRKKTADDMKELRDSLSQNPVLLQVTFPASSQGAYNLAKTVDISNLGLERAPLVLVTGSTWVNVSRVTSTATAITLRYNALVDNTGASAMLVVFPGIPAPSEL